MGNGANNCVLPVNLCKSFRYADLSASMFGQTPPPGIRHRACILMRWPRVTNLTRNPAARKPYPSSGLASDRRSSRFCRRWY